MPLQGFEWVEEISQLNEDFIENCNENSDEGYFLEVHVQNLERLQDLHNDLPFLPERVKIEKFEKLVANVNDEKEYAI